MPTPLSVLILEDRPADAELMLHELRQAGFAPSAQRVETEEQYLRCLDSPPEVILADYRLPQFDGMRALELLRARKLDVPFILVSGAIGEELAAEAVKRGAADYLLKDRLARLGHAVTAALEQKRMRQEKEQAARERERLFRQVRAARQRLQNLSHRLIEAQEAERRRLARELHDEIGQALTAVNLNLQAIQASLPDPDLRHRFAESTQIIAGTLEQVRALSLDLRPAVLDDLGLVAALEWYAERQAEVGKFACDFTAEPLPVPIPDDIQTTCFRVAQEAFTNILRHAYARRVQVELRLCPTKRGSGQRGRAGSATELVLTIRDNGVGFDLQAAKTRATRGASLGLLGMEERINLVGGHLQVESAVSHGTVICAHLPLTTPSGARRDERPRVRKA